MCLTISDIAELILLNKLCILSYRDISAEISQNNYMSGKTGLNPGYRKLECLQYFYNFTNRKGLGGGVSKADET